jgi:biotin synthesis protein BioG
MNFHLKKNSNDHLIVFFSGWGMDTRPLEELKSNQFDILTIFDYRDNRLPDLKSILKQYKNSHLIAWSMGVWASSQIPEDIKQLFSKRIAINGTLKPIDDRYGINSEIFSNTLKSMNETNRDLFYSNMFLTPDDFSEFQSKAPKRKFHQQLEELEILAKNISSSKTINHFDVALVGKKDKIFTFRNQMNYWKEKNIVKMIDAPHFPFNIWSSWDEIIEVL